jgi:hypothetical protein
LSISGAAAFGATTGAGIGGTAITAGGVLAEVAAFVSIGQGVHQHKESKRRAHGARKVAAENAATARVQAGNEAQRAVMQEAELGAEEQKRSVRDKGIVANLQNRSDVQIAALTREVDRETQALEAAAELRLEAVSSDVRSAYRNIQANENSARREARGPSNFGLALSLGSTALGSALEAA